METVKPALIYRETNVCAKQFRNQLNTVILQTIMKNFVNPLDKPFLLWYNNKAACVGYLSIAPWHSESDFKEVL